MGSRKLVEKVYTGIEPKRVPIHFETFEKRQEAALGDVLLGHAWVPMWSSFLDVGGPFRRGDENLERWAKEFDVESGYEWPSVDDVVQETVFEFKMEIGELRKQDKFFIFGVIGPTEQCEYFLCPPRPPRGLDLELSYHRFDFGVLTVLNKEKARKLYNKVSKYVLELVKAGAEIEWVDAVRVADDAFSYQGPIYPKWFMEELYLPWHKRFAEEIRKRGKFSILHSDGNLLTHNYVKKLSEIYDGLHPLDLSKKSTVADALNWVEDVVIARRSAERYVVFNTGIPIDLMMIKGVSAQDLALVVLSFLEKHGKKGLVLSTTHRPYPKRDYLEDSVFEKVNAVRKLVGLEKVDKEQLINLPNN